MRNVLKFDPGLEREHFDQELRERGEAGRYVVGWRATARKFDDVLERAQAGFGAYQEDIGLSADEGDVGEIARGVEAWIGAHDRLDRVIGDARRHQGIAVGLCVRRCGHSDEAATAGPIVDNEGRAKPWPELIGEQAGKRVRCAARR